MPGASTLRLRCRHCGGEAPLIGHARTTAATCSGCGTTFPCEAGIVTVEETADDRDYPAALHDVVARVEDRHFWFAARNRIILSTLRRVLGPLEAKALLEVGCGSGFVLSVLERAGLEVCGVDMHLAPLRSARARVAGPLVCSHALALPFFDDFDLVGLFDVIEHAEDDAAVLGRARAVLRPRGHVVVTVPAGPHLWTAYDQVTGHKRRYDRRGLAAALSRGGFRVEHISAFNCLPLVVQTLHRRFATAAGAAGQSAVEIVGQALKVPPEPFNTLLGFLMRLEAPLRAFPFVPGGSLIAIGERVE